MVTRVNGTPFPLPTPTHPVGFDASKWDRRYRFDRVAGVPPGCGEGCTTLLPTKLTSSSRPLRPPHSFLARPAPYNAPRTSAAGPSMRANRPVAPGGGHWASDAALHGRIWQHERERGRP